jgi:hypothetical protein
MSDMGMDDVPVWSEKEHQRELDLVRKDTGERCALLCEMMAGVYISHAATYRKEGEYRARAVWPFGKLITLIKPEFERAANVREGVARTFRTIGACCRAGWDPRALKTADDTRLEIPGIHFPGRDPEASEIV